MLLIALIAAVAFGGASTAGSVSAPASSVATPTPEPLSKDVRKEATAAGFADLADELARASRGAAVIDAGKPGRMPAAMGTSRIGGDPDLPTSARWPTCKGKPQTFLGQVRASDLPAEALDLRRLGGTLLFFTHVEFEPGETEYGLWAGDCSKVVHAREGTKLRRVARPKRGTLAIKSAPMRFAGRPDIPPADWEGELYPPLKGSKVADWEPYFDLRWGLLGRPNPGHQLLGYPDEPNGGDDCSERAKRAKQPWRHLFTMDWDEELGFMAADGGRLQMLISPADLKRGRFDRVCGVFDSA